MYSPEYSANINCRSDCSKWKGGARHHSCRHAFIILQYGGEGYRDTGQPIGKRQSRGKYRRVQDRIQGQSWWKYRRVQDWIQGQSRVGNRGNPVENAEEFRIVHRSIGVDYRGNLGENTEEFRVEYKGNPG